MRVTAAQARACSQLTRSAWRRPGVRPHQPIWASSPCCCTAAVPTGALAQGVHGCVLQGRAGPTPGSITCRQPQASRRPRSSRQTAWPLCWERYPRLAFSSDSCGQAWLFWLLCWALQCRTGRRPAPSAACWAQQCSRPPLQVARGQGVRKAARSGSITCPACLPGRQHACRAQPGAAGRRRFAWSSADAGDCSRGPAHPHGAVRAGSQRIAHGLGRQVAVHDRVPPIPILWPRLLSRCAQSGPICSACRLAHPGPCCRHPTGMA